MSDPDGWRDIDKTQREEIARLRSDAEYSFKRISELESENQRLREALEDIAVYGCGMLSQPAAMNAPEEVWLRKRLNEYERCARAALGQEGRDAGT